MSQYIYNEETGENELVPYTPEQQADLDRMKKEWDDGKYDRELAECNENRKRAYQNEADPIYFQVQRGDATNDEWLSKIEEIKNKFPKPEKE